MITQEYIISTIHFVVDSLIHRNYDFLDLDCYMTYDAFNNCKYADKEQIEFGLNQFEEFAKTGNNLSKIPNGFLESCHENYFCIFQIDNPSPYDDMVSIDVSLWYNDEVSDLTMQMTFFQLKENIYWAVYDLHVL